jgi:hypothetical protein
MANPSIFTWGILPQRKVDIMAKLILIFHVPLDKMEQTCNLDIVFKHHADIDPFSLEFG